MSCNGFTRDYHQIEGIFADDKTTVELDPKEYLGACMQYKNNGATSFSEVAPLFLKYLFISQLQFFIWAEYKMWGCVCSNPKIMPYPVGKR